MNLTDRLTPPSPRPLRWNAASNIAARLVQAALALVAVPILLRQMGTSLYGLVGFAVALDAFQFFDFGLSGAVYRQVARNVARGRHPDNADLLRAAELPYIGIGVVLALALGLAAPVLARDWFHASEASVETVTNGLVALAVYFLVKWPLSLFNGALRGLQQHVLVNGIGIGSALARTVLGVLVVVLVDASPAAYFITLSAVTVIQLALVVGLVRRRFGRARRPRPRRRAVLKGIWGFALALNAITLGIALLTQIPALLVGRYLGLHQLGLYAVAYALAAVVTYGSNAIADAAFPRLSAEFVRADTGAVRTTYYRSTRASVAFAAMACFPIVFLAEPLLRLWTGSASVGVGAAHVASLLAIGNLALAVWSIPYSLLLAEGRTRLLLAVVAVAIPALVVGLAVSLPRLGLSWAGSTWLALNVGMGLAITIAAHRTDQLGSWWRYLARDVVPLCAAGAVIFGLAGRIVGAGTSWMPVIAALVVGSVLFVAAAIMLVPKEDREWVLATVRKRIPAEEPAPDDRR